MGNLSSAWLIDFTGSKIRSGGGSENFAKEVETDWGDLLLSFLKLYRNSMFGFDSAQKRGSKSDRIKTLKRELMKSPHVGDIIKEIGEIMSKSNGGKSEPLGGLTEAARERDVSFKHNPKDIIFAEDGTVIGFKTAPRDSARGDNDPLEQIVFTSPFLKTEARVTDATIRNSPFLIPVDEENQKFPTEFRGNLAEGFVATKNDQQWRIRVTGHIYELYEEVCLDKRKPRERTPLLVLRINTQERTRSQGTVFPHKNVWYMSVFGTDGTGATFADARRHGRQCSISFQLCPMALEVSNDHYDYEINDPQPHDALGVAIGWRLVKVNEKKVNGLRSINEVFKTKKSPFETIFIKPETQPRRRPPCQTERQSRSKSKPGELQTQQYSPYVFIDKRPHNQAYIWEAGSEIKYFIDEASFPAGPGLYHLLSHAQVITKVRTSAARAALNWNQCLLGVTFVEEAQRDQALFDITYRDEDTLGEGFFPWDTIGNAYRQQCAIGRLSFEIGLYYVCIHETLTHEFGHILGLRHEFCREDADEKLDPAIQIGDRDDASIMIYAPRISITDKDRANTKWLYDRADGDLVPDCGHVLSDVTLRRIPV